MFICLNKSKIVIIILIIMAIFIGLIIPVTMANSNKNKYSILVDVEESKMYVMENGVCTKIYSCSGGKASTPSPIGTWTIISKAKWGEGFGGSWLGFNVPWGQFGIHGTTEKYSVVFSILYILLFTSLEKILYPKSANLFAFSCAFEISLFIFS